MVSPNSTLPNDEKEAQDSHYNPGEQHARELTGDHESIPGYDRANDGADALDPDNDSSAAVKDAEDKGGNWKSDYGGKKDMGGKQLTPMNVRAVLKKRGPLGLIALLGLGGGLAGTALFSPGLLLVQMKEALVNRFDSQLASMDARSTRLMNSKINGATTGICGKVITVACKYSTISEKQAARLKTAGIEVKGDTKFGGRIKPSAYTFKGKDLSPSEFANSTDPDLKAAKLRAYNPKFAGFSDAKWNKVAAKLGITKQRALPDSNDNTARAKALDDEVQNGEKLDLSDDGVTCNEDESVCTRKGANGEDIDLTSEERAARKAAIAAAGEVLVDGEQSTAKSVISDVVTKGVDASVHTAGNFIKITGPIDIACQAYSAVRGLGYAAKTVRAIQLARYAMIFVNTADQIKAGTAKPEDVAYLGGILTSLAGDAVAGVKRKAAMDSAGMRYTLFGETAGFKSADGTYLSQFMAGGGLTGDLIAITDYINTSFTALGVVNPRSTCATLNNSFVQLGSAAAGIALMFVPGVDVVIGVSDVAKGVASAGVSVMLAVLPELLKGIVAGNVTKGIVGQDSGDAIASGFGVIASDTAQAGGNAPMSVDDAVAYSNLNDQVATEYTSDEAKTLSPFDPSNKDTFVGSIVNKLLPFVSTTGNIDNPFVAFGTLATSSFASILPSVSAVSTEQTREAYSSCTDPDYQELGIATDPFCNPVFGIPPQYLNKDPVTVANDLNGQYDPVSGDPAAGSDYAKYVDNCINRENPLGSKGQDENSPGTDGAECKINSSNADYYLFYTDQRVDADMEDNAVIAGSDDSSTSTDTVDPTQPTDGADDTAPTDDAAPTDSTDSTDTAPVDNSGDGTPQSVILNSLTAFNDPATETLPASIALKTTPEAKNSLAYVPHITIGWYWSVA